MIAGDCDNICKRDTYTFYTILYISDIYRARRQTYNGTRQNPNGLLKL